MSRQILTADYRPSESPPKKLIGENIYNRSSLLEGRLLATFDVGDRRSSTAACLALLPGSAGNINSAELSVCGFEAGVGLSIPLGRSSGNLFADGSVEPRSNYSNLSATVGRASTSELAAPSAALRLCAALAPALAPRRRGLFIRPRLAFPLMRVRARDVPAASKRPGRGLSPQSSPDDTRFLDTKKRSRPKLPRFDSG